MCDKTFKNIEEVEEIIKSVTKDDVDTKTLDAKLVHMEQKLNHLKQQILSTDRKHHQMIERKSKEVNKYLQRQRSAQANIQKIVNRVGSGHKEQKNNGNISNFQQEEIQYNWNKDKAQISVLLQKQSKLRMITEQKMKEQKLKMYDLEQKLRKSELATKKLKEQSQKHRQMLEKLINEEDEQSSQQRSEDSDYNSSDESDNERMEVQLSQNQRERNQRQGRSQMMQMTQNRCKIIIDDEQVYVVDTQSQQQECNQEEYDNYDSDQQAELQKLSKIIKEEEQVQEKQPCHLQHEKQQCQVPEQSKQPQEKMNPETQKIETLIPPQIIKDQEIKLSPALSKQDTTKIRGYSWWRSLRKFFKF